MSGELVFVYFIFWIAVNFIGFVIVLNYFATLQKDE